MVGIRRRRSRYINKQRHQGTCGPIAIANVIKWHRIETSYKAVWQFCQGIRACHPKRGMFPYQMRYALRTLQIKFKLTRKVTVRQVDKILANGGCLILIYDTKRSGSHAVFIDRAYKNGFRVWNKYSGKGPWYYKSAIRDDIRRSKKFAGHLYAYVFYPRSENDKNTRRS